MKQCPRCSTTKPYSDFHKSNQSKDGHASYCRSCQKEYSEKHYEKKYGRKFPKEKFIDGKRYCTICQEYKDLSSFKKSNKSWCAQCTTERDRQRYDGTRVYPRKMLGDRYHCRNCGEYYSEEDMHLSNRNNKYPGRTFCKECFKSTNHIRNVRGHGLTEDQYFQILEEQNYSCKICKEKESSSKKRLSIDHDHKHCPGERGCAECFRGLLCHKCNTALGGFRDRVDLLQKAIEYLTA
jgi:hypothetical protein